MSTQSISSSSSSATSSGAYKTGDQLQSLGGNSAMQVTGLASGLDTNAIVTALMATATQQVTNLQNQQTGITSENALLQTIQTSLQKVASDAQALGAPSLFANVQSVTSSNSSEVGATLTSGASGLIGSYQVSVQALATASQQTYTFNSPVPSSGSDTLTFGSGPSAPTLTVAPGSTADDLVNAINANSNLPVWATVTQEPPSAGGAATIVFQDRNTGAPPTNGSGQPVYTPVTDSASLLSATGANTPGTDAQYTIGANSYTSSSNTISGNALGTGSTPTEGQGAQGTIPGVTLSLNAQTGSTPITVTVGTPAPSSQNIQTAVQQFVTDYNSAISTIQAAISQTPSSSDPTQGTLYGDSDLQQLLSSMRDMMDQSFSGLSGSITSMLGAGVSTGATTGTGAISQTSLSGDLTLDASTLTSALQSNASGVQSMFTSWSINFSNLVNNEAAPGGTIDTRISADGTQSSYLATQIQNMQQANTQQQQELVQQFANMEAALSQSQSTSSWLTSQLSSLPGG